jgi:hypothetical protein
MDLSEIDKMVHHFYWEEDINCATTVMKILAAHYKIPINGQVLDSLIGMHGAGKYGTQCGLVEGALLFIGIWGRYKNLKDEIIVKSCYQYAEAFEKEFKDLRCSVLRPEGFHEGNPPHLCEELSKKSIKFTIGFMDENMMVECI